MVDDWVIKTMYATKRRRKNPKGDDASQYQRQLTNTQTEKKSRLNGTKNHNMNTTFTLNSLALKDTFELNGGVNLHGLTPHHGLSLLGQDPSSPQSSLSLASDYPNLHPATGSIMSYSTAGSQTVPNSNTSTSTPMAKSNPSKRHRERLNAELERLSSLLPFEESVIAKLDKLSILRLAVSYLRMKSYFQTIWQDRQSLEHRIVSHLYHFPIDLANLEGDACLQALNGFIFIVSCDGEVFSTSQNVESYLGFHQSDILHQSVMELIHSEDREEFRRQLSWHSMLPREHNNLTLSDLMTSKYCHLLQRCFTVRFRCLLDNTSGFITLEINGRLQFLHGQSKIMRTAALNAQKAQMNGESLESIQQSTYTPKVQGRGGNHSRLNNNQNDSNLLTGPMALPPIGLFAVCSPLGPLPSLDGAHRDVTFKTKHRLDLAVLNMDNRARLLFNYKEDEELQTNLTKGYEFVHQDDLKYVGEGHKEVLRTGSVGLLVHRWLSKNGSWIWLQSRIKIAYKNGNPDSLLAIHRQLSEEEGRELYIRRNKEYKLPFPLLEPETLLGDEELSGSGSCSAVINAEIIENSLSNFDVNSRLYEQSHEMGLNYFNEQDPYKLIQSYQRSESKRNITSSHKIEQDSQTIIEKTTNFPHGQKDYLNTSRRRKKEPSSHANKVSKISSDVLNSESYFNQHYSGFGHNVRNYNSSSLTGLESWADMGNMNNPFSQGLLKDTNGMIDFNYVTNDYSSAWLAVVAAAASKYQQNGIEVSSNYQKSSNGNMFYGTKLNGFPGSEPHGHETTEMNHLYSTGIDQSNSIISANSILTNHSSYSNQYNAYLAGQSLEMSMRLNPLLRNGVGSTNEISSEISLENPLNRLYNIDTSNQLSTTNIHDFVNSNQNENSLMISSNHNFSGSASSSESVGSGPEMSLNHSGGSMGNPSEKIGSSLNMVENMEVLYQYSLNKLSESQFNELAESSNPIHIPVVRRSWTESSPNSQEELSENAHNRLLNQSLGFNQTALFQ